jgi:hypothetical protein
MPLKNTKVIGESWSRHHAAAARGGMNATITFGVADGPPTPSGDDMVQHFTSDYTGPARIQALGRGDRATAAAGQDVRGRIYLVQIDFDAYRPPPGARGKVTAAVNDPGLVGEDLWVLDPQLGSERFTRDVICSDNQTDANSSV